MIFQLFREAEKKKTRLLSIAIGLLTVFSMQRALACKPCSKLNQLAKESVKATPDKATAIIGQTNEVFQEVNQAQPKLEASTAYDMIAIAMNLMDQDPSFVVIDNLQEIIDDPAHKAVFEQQLKRFRPKEVETFRKRLKSVREQGATDHP